MSTTTEVTIPAGTWVADPDHSRVGFSIRHLGIATVRGDFAEFEAQLVVPDDHAGIHASGTVAVASIDTGVEQRDGHLRSPDFFEVETYPTMSFASTRIERGDVNEFLITGDLELHGVKREITLTCALEGTETDPWGGERVGLKLVGELSRGDFGMRFNEALRSGNVLVGDKVTLTIDVSAVKAT